MGWVQRGWRHFSQCIFSLLVRAMYVQGVDMWPLFSMLEMSPRKPPPASCVGRAGGSMHRRYCEVCRFHSVGICHLANSQVSAIPVRVSYSLHGQSHDEVSSQVLAIPKVWQSWFLQGASGEHCDRGPCAGPAGCPRREVEGGGHLDN